MEEDNALSVSISGSSGRLYVDEIFSGDTRTLFRRQELHFITTEEMISDDQLPEIETLLQNLLSAGKHLQQNVA